MFWSHCATPEPAQFPWTLEHGPRLSPRPGRGFESVLLIRSRCRRSLFCRGFGCEHLAGQFQAGFLHLILSDEITLEGGELVRGQNALSAQEIPFVQLFVFLFPLVNLLLCEGGCEIAGEPGLVAKIRGEFEV